MALVREYPVSELKPKICGVVQKRSILHFFLRHRESVVSLFLSVVSLEWLGAEEKIGLISFMCYECLCTQSA